MSATMQEPDQTKPGRSPDGAAPGKAHRLAPLTGVASTLMVIAGIVVLEGVAD